MRRLWSEGKTTGQIGNAVGKDKHMVGTWLKRIGIYEKRMPQAVKGFRCIGHEKRMHSPNRLILDGYIRDCAALKPTDDCGHWWRHRECVRTMANISARAQFQKHKSNPKYRFKKAIRVRIWKILKLQGRAKEASSTQYIGCDHRQLREHIAKQFVDGMTWDNYGTKWECDHIIPCASFDLGDQEQARKCFHYTNLRPLAKSENRKKSSHYNGYHHRHRKIVWDVVSRTPNKSYQSSHDG